MDVGSLTGGSASGQIAQANKFSEMTSSDFVKVMFEELKNQDPTDPQDTTKLLEQISSLRTIESQTSLKNQLENLVSQNQLASAGNLIGKLVEGLDGSNNQIQGLVTSVKVKDDQVMLELDNGKQLNMNRITSITGAAANALAGGALSGASTG